MKFDLIIIRIKFDHLDKEPIQSNVCNLPVRTVLSQWSKSNADVILSDNNMTQFIKTGNAILKIYGDYSAHINCNSQVR